MVLSSLTCASRRCLLVPAVLPLLVMATACTGDGGKDAGPEPIPTEINPCEGATPASGCITSTPAATTTYPYPADAGAISPLPVPEAYEGELVRKTNNLTPGVRTATFTITVPAGKILATNAICQGRGEIVVTTKPESLAEVTMNCDGNDVPSELGVFDAKPLTTATTYTYTLRASGPSRWLVAASARAPQ